MECLRILLNFFKKYYKGFLNLFTTIFYSVDIYLDIMLAILFFRQGDIVWGYLTSAFIIIPLVIGNFAGFYGIYRTREEHLNDFGILKDWRIRLLFCVTMTLPLALQILCIYDSFKRTDNKRVFAGKGMKLLEVFLESLPQSCLQLYIIFQVLYGNNETVIVDWWQWTSLAISLANLSFSIATGYFQVDRAAYGEGGHAGTDPSFISQVAFFLFGGLSLLARLIVCSMLSVFEQPLWLVPFFSLVTVTLIVWLVKRFGTKSLVDYPHHDKSPTQIGLIILIGLTTSLYNGFTGTGTALSLVNLGIAIGSYFYLPVSMTTVGVIAISLAYASLAGNMILTIIPQLRSRIEKDWCLPNKSNKTTFF